MELLSIILCMMDRGRKWFTSLFEAGSAHYTFLSIVQVRDLTIIYN